MSFWSHIAEQAEFDRVGPYERLQMAARCSDDELIKLLRKRGYVIRRKAKRKKNETVS